MKPPKVGQDIYVPGALYLSHGADDFEGGRAKVTAVKKVPYNGGDYAVEIEERPGHSYMWSFLADEQEELKKEYGVNRAHPDPDDRPEFNRWD